jgi:hypothetical protein
MVHSLRNSFKSLVYPYSLAKVWSFECENQDPIPQGGK